MSRDPLAGYLDRQGRVALWPSKRSRKDVVLRFLASKFEAERRYTEKEVNTILDQWHTFDDRALLRREMFDAGYFDRLPDGAAYWRVCPSGDSSGNLEG